MARTAKITNANVAPRQNTAGLVGNTPARSLKSCARTGVLPTSPAALLRGATLAFVIFAVLAILFYSISLSSILLVWYRGCSTFSKASTTAILTISLCV